LELGIQGTVWVSFIVDKEGKITEVTLLKSVHPDLDREALKAVNQLPNMIPGKQRDKAVKVKYQIPIKFELK
jgi:protein TonB